MLQISNNIQIPDSEIEVLQIRAQGPGGQHVNKVSTAIQLRFDIRKSSLPDFYKEKLLSINDQRLSLDGVIVIKAQKFRSQEKNREDAYHRLRELIRKSTSTPKRRVATRPTLAAKKRRVESKVKKGRMKGLRGKVDYDT